MKKLTMLSITLENNMLISYDLTNSESHFFLIGPNIVVRCVKKIRDQTRRIQNSQSGIRNLVDLSVKSTRKE